MSRNVYIGPWQCILASVCDGLVHSANMRTTNGTSIRPITKLHPLDLLAVHDEPLAGNVATATSDAASPLADPISVTRTSGREFATRAKAKLKVWAKELLWLSYFY